MPSAKADLAFDFTMQLPSGSATGMLTGSLVLPFVSTVGSSGTGAASVVQLTSFPAGFGVLAGGNTITSWAHQVSNAFTVTNGSITSFAFFAVTGIGSIHDDMFLMHSTTGTIGGFGVWGSPAGLNELSKTSAIFGYNFAGFGGVTFTPVVTSSVPESSSLGWALVCAVGLAAGRKRISR